MKGCVNDVSECRNNRRRNSLKEMRWNRIKRTSNRMSLETSASESGEKYVNEFMLAGKMCLTDCGVENCVVRFVIVLMKNSKLSAVRVDGGGQRREENVLKS